MNRIFLTEPPVKPTNYNQEYSSKGTFSQNIATQTLHTREYWTRKTSSMFQIVWFKSKLGVFIHKRFEQLSVKPIPKNFKFWWICKKFSLLWTVFLNKSVIKLGLNINVWKSQKYVSENRGVIVVSFINIDIGFHENKILNIKYRE